MESAEYPRVSQDEKHARPNALFLKNPNRTFSERVAHVQDSGFASSISIIGMSSLIS